MKRKPKSAPLGCLLAVLCLLGLCGCGDIRWPHVFGPDEVPQNVKNAPRPFDNMAPVSPDQTFPRLGDVPSKPKNFTPADEIDKTKQEMGDQRTEAEGLVIQKQMQHGQ